MTQEKQVFINRLRRLVTLKVIRIGEKVIRDLAHEDLDRQVVLVFLEKFSEEKDSFRPQYINDEILFQTGFPLDVKTSGKLRRQIMEWFPEVKHIKFDISSELGVGVRVMAGDRKIEWNLSSYLKGLEKEILADLSGLTREKP